MQPILAHIHPLRSETFGGSRELLHRSSRDGRHSPALLITCADAGLLAEHLTQTNPDGFCFASDLGTFVPPANAVADGEDDSLAATIEYAVRVLQVGDIVVCGHSPCGAMATLLRGSPLIPSQSSLAWWLEQTAPFRDLIHLHDPHLTRLAERHRAAELESVLLSLANLPTYPCVRERLNQGTLHLHGWFHEHATRELFAYDPVAGQLELLTAIGEGRRA
ncbi:MAG: carbonic anhydrase [Verrucomicrobia bacterium]|nr:carbonic anhydrase [Verrucomicrobiota bacterium]